MDRDQKWHTNMAAMHVPTPRAGQGRRSQSQPNCRRAANTTTMIRARPKG